MKKRIILTILVMSGLAVISLSQTIGAEYTSEWSGREELDYAPLIFIFIILIVFSILMYFLYKRHQDSYDKELEQLDRQFRDGAISEENYIGMKQDLDRKHHRYKSKHQYKPSTHAPMNIPVIYCSKCGNNLRNEDIFCTQCGAKKN